MHFYGALINAGKVEKYIDITFMLEIYTYVPYIKIRGAIDY